MENKGQGFYRTDLRRISNDLMQELEADEPDWLRLVAKAEDLRVLATMALQKGSKCYLIRKGR